MIATDKNHIKRILNHILFWLLYIAFNTFINGYTNHNYKIQFLSFLCYLPVVLSATYFTLYVLIPRYLLKKKVIFNFIISIIITAFIFALLQQLIIIYFLAPWLYPNYTPSSLISIAIFYRMITIYEVVAVAAAIKLFRYWYQTEYLKQQIEKEKLNSELAYLKAQIHPHFLFNTLNNLYSLSLKNDTRTSEIILKLSDLLDYMLYKCNKPYIRLIQEIELLEIYITLEKLRLRDPVNIIFETIGDLNNQQIAPLILLPFVENAFKHNTSNPWINIQLSVVNNQLHFMVKNSKTLEENRYSEEFKGIGLSNIKRRLALLYPGTHRLDIINNQTYFEITLTLNLTIIRNEHENTLPNC